ncbi:hypothetical protein [Actinacidiphila glaucinigra]|uniref:hypothetical protein n=1 Tax=Actinacidiphila glaucinigra TaxID=235986 RepID=UPI0036733639
MSERSERWIDTGSGPGRMIPIRVAAAVGRANNHYRQFLDHSKDCAECAASTDGCATAKELLQEWFSERGERD